MSEEVRYPQQEIVQGEVEMRVLGMDTPFDEVKGDPPLNPLRRKEPPVDLECGDSF